VSSSGEPPRSSGSRSWAIPRSLRIALWASLLWTAMSVFFASQIVVLQRGRASWAVALSLTMPRWYVWGLLTPGIFWVDRRIGLNRSLPARLACHVPLGIAWTSLSIFIRLVSRPLRGSPWPPSIWLFFVERFYWDLVIYAVIAGVSIARDYAAQVRQLVEARLQSLRAQLQPHFLFNALNTISAFTETSPRTARRLMGQLGDLLRASLTHAARPLVTLGEELTFLDDYLAIESARFEGRITVSVQADDDLLGTLVPSFLLQPLVENAIRHGVAPRVSGGHVQVTATRHGTVLRLRVRDDGVGLSPDWELRRSAGVGLRNVASRLEHLYGRRDLMRIERAPSGGVDVQLDLPVTLRAAAPASATEAASAGS
jgi:two-component system LytT family sensor kinase